MNYTKILITFCLYLITLQEFAFCEHQNMIVLGPVIGKVTSFSSRILVEFSSDGVITPFLRDKNHTKFSHSSVSVRKNIPVILKFSNLKNNTRYTLHFKESIKPLVTTNEGYFASFKTIIGESFGIEKHSFNFAVVSCNDYHSSNRRNHSHNLLSVLAKKAKLSEIDYIFHIGDQIYLDMDNEMTSPYIKTLTLLGRLDPKEFHKYKHQVYGFIRQAYIETWTYLPMAETLSNIPNLMMMDDHEIRNDFAFVNVSKNSIEYFFIQLSLFNYLQYQRQLREDLNIEKYRSIIDNMNSVEGLENLVEGYKGLKDEFYFETLNGVGFFMLDYRGPKVLYKHPLDNDEINHLGYNQTKALNEVFSNSGSFKDVKAAVLLSTHPVIIYNHEYTKYITEIALDYQEYWTFKYELELIRMFDTLRKWSTDTSKIRELLIVGGDVHASGNTQICYQNKPWVKQFFTSGVNNYMYPIDVMGMTEDILRQNQRIGGGYSFIHHDFSVKENIGLITVSIINGKPLIETQTVELKRQHYGLVIDKFASSYDNSTLSFIFNTKVRSDNFDLSKEIGCSNGNSFNKTDL